MPVAPNTGLLIDGIVGTRYASQAQTDAAAGKLKPSSTYIDVAARDRLATTAAQLAAEAARRKAAADAAAAQKAAAVRAASQTAIKAPIQVPAAPPTDDAGGGGAAPVSFFNLDEIRAALDAISANFELERGQLEGSRGSIGRALELLLAKQDQDRAFLLRENKARNSGSGRIRSGLFLRDQGQIVDTFADQAVRARAETDAKLNPILLALSTLNARRDAAKSAEARRIGREQLATQEEIARALELI